MTDSILRNIYFNVDHPACFAGADALHRAARQQLPNLTRSQVKEWLSQHESYTLHKPARKRFPRNPIVVTGIDALWELDLADLSRYKSHNDGFRYLLQVIDVGSRFAFSVPLRSKKPLEVAESFEKLIKTVDRKPAVCTFDAGKEFTGAAFQKMLRKHEIYSYVSTSDMKCSIVERWNRTLKTRMWRYFTHNNTYRWKDILQKLVHAYNNSKHRTISCKPSEVTRDSVHEITQRILNRAQLKKPPKFAFEINDRVRISRSKGVFEKGFEPNWTREIFVICSRKADPRPAYKLKDLNDESVGGIFYETQLQKVSEPLLHKIEKILRWRTLRGGKRQGLVRFMGYSADFDQWVDETDLVNL